MIDIMNRFPEEETALREMERVFHSHVDKKEQPDEAFYINAASMMKTLKMAPPPLRQQTIPPPQKLRKGSPPRVRLPRLSRKRLRAQRSEPHDPEP